MAPRLVKWAQRSSPTDPERNVIYLTIEAAGAVEPQFSLTSSAIRFSGISSDSDSKHYYLDLSFYAPIDPSNSFYTLTGRGIRCVLRKAVPQAEYWPRLTQTPFKAFWLRTDFDKWVDEDEQFQSSDELNHEEWEDSFETTASRTNNVWEGVENIGNVFSGIGGLAGSNQLLESVRADMKNAKQEEQGNKKVA